jgi:predicted AlkP superfamily phosphohydrolase/phosphomutase
MQKYNWDFLMVVFNGTDRIQHELWKYLDKKNPQYDQNGAEIYGNAILNYYIKIDKVIGRLLQKIDENTISIIMSDHGAGSLHKFIYINSWLLNNGLLKLKDDLLTWIKFWMFKNGFSPTNLYKLLHKLGLGKIRETVDKDKEYKLLKTVSLSFANVDWARTKAYSIGGQIFLNVKDREPEGIIDPKEYYKVRNCIINKLYKLKDPETGADVIGKVLKKEEIYFGECVNAAADLIPLPKDEKYVIFSEHEFGAKSPIGRSFGISGWHRMNGIFVMTGKNIKKGVKIPSRNIIDIAPTIFFIMNLPIPKDIDGRVIKDAFFSTFLKSTSPKYSEIKSTGVQSEFRYSKAEKEEIEKRLRDIGYI